MMNLAAVSNGIKEIFAPIWLEVMFAMFFAVGFHITMSSHVRKGKNIKSKTVEKGRRCPNHKRIEADVKAAKWDAALRTWNAEKDMALAPPSTIKAILQALLMEEPDILVDEIIGHFSLHADSCEFDVDTRNMVLEVVSRTGRVDLMDELARSFECKLKIISSPAVFEILIGGHAAAGNKKRVEELFVEASQCYPEASMSRGHSVAVKGFLKNGLLYDALCHIQEMQSKGYAVPSFMMSELLRRACRGDRYDETFEAALTAKAVKIPEDSLIAVLDDCVKREDLQLALRMEKIARKVNGQLPGQAYDALMKVCVSHKDERGIEIFRGMVTDNLQHVNVGFCIWLLGRCHDAEFPRLSEEIVRFVYSRAGMTIACHNVLVEKGMYKIGRFVDIYAAKIMMKAMSVMDHCHMFGKAWDLLDSSSVDICACPDDEFFDLVLFNCVRHNQKTRLESLVACCIKIKRKPSAKRLASLMDACGKLKCLEKCRELWQNIIGTSAPNEVVLESMIEAVASNYAVHEAVTLLTVWKSKVPPTTAMYSSIIKAYTASKQPVEARKLWQQICKSKLGLDIVLFNIMMESQALAGAMDEVCRLVSSMPKHGVIPDATTYSVIIRGYCHIGEIDKAFDVFSSIQKKGLVLEVAAYKSIMEDSIAKNRFDIADSVMEDLDRKFRSDTIKLTSYALGILIKMYGQRNRLDKAFEVVGDLSSKHSWVKPNIQVRTSLMTACLSNHDPDRAMKIFEEIKAAGQAKTYGTDAKTYGLMLSGLSRMGCLSEAIAIVEDAYGLGKSGKRGLHAGHTLDGCDFDEFVRALRQRKLLQSLGGPLFDRMYAARLELPGRLLQRGAKF